MTKLVNYFYNMENLKGSKNSWGLIAKAFHWVLAIFILSQIFFGINLHYMGPTGLKGDLIHFHKILGTIILFLIFLRLLWKFYNPSPDHNALNIFHKLTSKFIHGLLYLLLFLLPIQGMFLTWVSGSDVIFLGLFKLPRLIEEDFILHDEILKFHFRMTMVLVITFLIHLSGTLFHIFIYKDKYKVWKSMKFLSKNSL